MQDMALLSTPACSDRSSPVVSTLGSAVNELERERRNVVQIYIHLSIHPPRRVIGIRKAGLSKFDTKSSRIWIFSFSSSSFSFIHIHSPFQDNRSFVVRDESNRRIWADSSKDFKSSVRPSFQYWICRSLRTKFNQMQVELDRSRFPTRY